MAGAPVKNDIEIACIGVPAPGEKELCELAIDNEKIIVVSAEELKNINGLDLVQSLTPIPYSLRPRELDICDDVIFLNRVSELNEAPFSKFNLNYKPKESKKFGNNRKGHTRKPKTKKTHRKKKK